MQPTPFRLAQAIRTAFQVARPVSRSFVTRHSISRPSNLQCHLSISRKTLQPIRWYSDKKVDVESKVENAKSRIEDTIQNRAKAVNTTESGAKREESGATIIHTNPEASSYVHVNSDSDRSNGNLSESSIRNGHPSLPSTISKSQSTVSKRFSNIMDNLQSNIFTASQRLNDLTGYSGIEALKNDITNQESNLQALRQSVKDAREAYQSAIATRSATQREVNDLLHRKHNWTPSDLERFTSLYRSDHKNEQDEIKAQQVVSQKEAEYEEASTKLARTILARYHEEQIWSDKIRQMSTWGTWGLMGLNVLLFVVFQIAIEPWRRARLVRGFEEKVRVALEHQDDRLSNLEAQGQTPSRGPTELVLDLIAGADSDEAILEQAEVEAAVERATENELQAEQNLNLTKLSSDTGAFAYYKDAFREMFSDHPVVVSQRTLSTIALEGVAAGAACMGLLFVVLRPR